MPSAKCNLTTAAPPLFVHANGVDAKEYMLRDRGLWFLDDHPFNATDRFLEYDHAPGARVEDDFAQLLAALEVARLNNCPHACGSEFHSANSGRQRLTTSRTIPWPQPRQKHADQASHLLQT